MITIEVEGLTNVIRSFSAGPLDPLMHFAMIEMAAFIEGQGKLQMPVLTGAAMRSWEGHVTKHGPVVLATFEGVYYIPRLDAGYSQKAPARFLSGIVEAGVDIIFPERLYAMLTGRAGAATPAGSLHPQLFR